MGDITVNKTNGGLGRRETNADMISGLLANGVSVAGGVQLGTAYALKSLDDAIAIKIDSNYDTDNTVLVYEHIKEYFRINPNGDLRLLLVGQATSFADMVDNAEADNAKKLLLSQNGDIRMLAVAYNPAVAVADFSATSAAIPLAQALADAEAAAHRPVEIFLEGKGFDHAAPVDFRALNAANVSVIIGQALTVVNAHADFSSYAAIGTLLGVYSRAGVNESGAWVAKNNLLGGSLTAASISGDSIDTLSDGLKDTLDSNGSIFFKTIVGIAGFYFNDSATCTVLTDDFAYIESNRTINKAIRAIRTALLPSLNAPIKVDPDTGQLPPQVIKADEAIARRALSDMQNNDEVSGIEVYMDPTQNVLATSKRIIKFSIIPTGTGRSITVEIGFSNPNNN